MGRRSGQRSVGRLLLAVAILGAAVASARVVDKVVAVVGGEIILLSELEERARPFMSEVEKEANAQAQKKKLATVQREVLDRLIDEQLIVQQAQDLKIQVGPEDVDRALEDVQKQNNLTKEQFVQALKDAGMTLTVYRQDLKRQILRLKVLSMAVGSRVSVTDEDLKTYYEQNVKSAGTDRKVKASHIFIAIPEGASAQVVEQKRTFAADLVQRARKGEDFAKLARENSEDAVTRRDGGDLGWFGKGSLPAPVEEIVFAMEPGEVRGPIRAERGFHVMKLLERKDEDVRPFAEVKEQMRAALRQQEMEKQTRNWLVELRKKAHIDVRL